MQFHPDGTPFLPPGAPYVLDPAVEHQLHQLLLAHVRAGVSVRLLRVNASLSEPTPQGTTHQHLGSLVDPASILAQLMRSAAVVISPYSPFLQNLLFVDHRAGVNASTDVPSDSSAAMGDFNASPMLVEVNQVMWRRSFRSANLQLCAAVGMRYWLVEHRNFSYAQPLTEAVNKTTVLRALQSAGVLPVGALVSAARAVVFVSALHCAHMWGYPREGCACVLLPW